MILEALEKAEGKGFALAMPKTREESRTLTAALRILKREKPKGWKVFLRLSNNHKDIEDYIRRYRIGGINGKYCRLSDAWNDYDYYLLATDCVFDVLLLILITCSN